VAPGHIAVPMTGFADGPGRANGTQSTAQRSMRHRSLTNDHESARVRLVPRRRAPMPTSAVRVPEDHVDGHPIERRMVRFDWSETAPHWVPDDPLSTHVINELAEAIKPFTQQEAWHAQAHAAVLDHLAAQHIDTKATPTGPRPRRPPGLAEAVAPLVDATQPWCGGRHRALHGGSRQLDPCQHRLGCRQGRSGDARPPSLARSRGGRAPGVGHRCAPGRRWPLPATAVHDARFRPVAGCMVASWCPLPSGSRPLAAGSPVLLEGLPPGGSPGPPAQRS